MRAACLAIVLLLAWSARAGSTPHERAALAAIDLGPEVPRYLRAKAIVQIEKGLAAAGYDVLPSAEVEHRLVGDLATCRDDTCVRLVGDAVKVPILVFANIDKTGENIVITMRLYDAATGHRDAEVRDVCDLCGEAEFAERLSLVASTLRAGALEARERGKQLSASPVASSRSEPAAPAAPEPPSIIPGVLIGAAGVLTMGGGITLLAIDGSGTCTSGDKPVYPAPGAVIRYLNDGSYVCRYVYHTKDFGIATTALGAAALAVGVTLIVRARRHSTVEVAPVVGGAQVKASIVW